MISDIFTGVIFALIAVLVIYPAARSGWQSWQTWQRRHSRRD